MAKSTWSNWAGNVTASPASFERPADEAAVAALVARAAGDGRTVRVVGAGHSFTPVAATDGHLVSLDDLSGIRSIDRDNRRVTVGAGTRLWALNEMLAAEGLAMANLGDIAYQSVAGAVSTSTHGTGQGLTGLAAQVVGMRIVDGSGNVHVADARSNPDLLDVGRVSVGALGVLTEVTLQVVDSFALRAEERPMRIDDILDGIDELRLGNDHFEFFWVPHTDFALTKRNNRTTEPLQPLPRVRGWFDKVFMENHAFGALCRVGRARPSLIPRLAKVVGAAGSRTYVETSHKVFASPRLVRFYEMEHAIPVAALVPAMNELRAMIERRGHLLNFPVEVRFTAADDIPLSTAHGRETAYIAVHVFQGMEHERFFRDVEDVMRAHGARPHWGKMHSRDAGELSALYPRWNEFISMRNRMDPGRTFANPHMSRILGE